MKTQTTLATIAFCAALVIGCERQPGTGASDYSSDSSSGTGSSTSAPAGTSGELSATNKYDADNTGLNQRDRSDAALTAQDQGSSEADREISRQIRQAITANDQFSADAKNVKVITQNGKVTLRGPVASTEEQQALGSAAQGVAGVTSVDNQLEVKRNQNTQQ